MKRTLKVVLLSMAMLAVVYVSVVVYADEDSSSDYRGIGYYAYEYTRETPPTDWYTPEQLGIISITECGIDGRYWLLVGVDLEKQPFPLYSHIFKYKGKFYQFTQRNVSIAICGKRKPNLIPVAAALGLGGVFMGVLLIKKRKAK